MVDLSAELITADWVLRLVASLAWREDDWMVLMMAVKRVASMVGLWADGSELRLVVLLVAMMA